MTIHSRLIKAAKCLLALLIVSLFVPASVSADAVDESSVLAFSNKNLRGRDKDYRPVNSWTPYFTWIGNVQDCSKLTVAQSTMGLGFLYGSKVRGNLKVTPSVETSRDQAYAINAQASNEAIGTYSYNRTPVYEYMYGYKIFSWFSVLFSIQNQSGINVQTNPVKATKLQATAASPAWGPAGSAGSVLYQFRSQLALNSLMFKAYFQLPWVLVWKNWMFAMNLSAGIGPGWQSWTNNVVYSTYTSNSDGVGDTTFVNTLGQKYAANCVYQIDAGIRMKPACLPVNMSIVYGCKYNQWGQMRSIGKLTQQKAYKYGLYVPITTKVLYSFVPYLGFQWNF